MSTLKGEQVLMRIFVGEADRHGKEPLYRALVALFRKEKIAGATVVRGICGYGAKSHMHTANLLRLSQDLPVIIEVIDTREQIDRILPSVNDMMNEGLVTLETVQVLRYCPDATVSN